MVRLGTALAIHWSVKGVYAWMCGMTELRKKKRKKLT